MPHDESTSTSHHQPRQPTTHATQQGVGQGRADRRRRPPRKSVVDSSISEASGISLGVDGSPHPIETDNEGNLRVVPRDTNDLLQELIGLHRATVFILALQHGWDPQELIDMAQGG